MCNCYGYHRTSTNQQKLDRGIQEISKYCKIHKLKLKNIFSDQQTGKNFNREGYIRLKKTLKKGDTLIVTEMDRLGRNKKAIIKELRYYQENGVKVRVLELPTPVEIFESHGDDTAVLMNETIYNIIIEIYAALAQAEMQKREKRQREGIEQMKLRGEWDLYGRPRSIAKEDFETLYQQVLQGKLTRKEFCEKHQISESTYYRYQKQLLEKERY